MARLRNALMAVTLATGVMGCAHVHDYAHWSIFHCSECDDFPTPAYGPGGTQMSGSYSGPLPENTPGTSRMMTPPSSNIQPPNNEAIETPPEERPATPPAPPAAGNP